MLAFNKDYDQHAYAKGKNMNRINTYEPVPQEME
jgi:hypothetical protein